MHGSIKFSVLISSYCNSLHLRYTETLGNMKSKFLKFFIKINAKAKFHTVDVLPKKILIKLYW